MELIQSLPIDEFIARRDAIASQIKASEQAFEAAKNLYKQSQVGYSKLLTCTVQKEFEALSPQSSFRSSERFDFSSVLRGFDAQAWGYLMDQSGLLSLMSSAARSQWERNIIDCKTPELTLENVQATFKNLHDRRQEMFEQGVLDSFNSCSWNHKTNSPVKFGKKLIFKGRNDRWTSFNTTNLQSIDDLRRVFYLCDELPQPDHRHGVCATMSGNKTWSFEDDYVRVEGFKNSNIHCHFKRPDLIERLNKILARHYPGALPEPK